EGMADECRRNRERRQRQRRRAAAPTDRQGRTGTELNGDRRGQGERRRGQAERGKLRDPARPAEELRRAAVEEHRREAEPRCRPVGTGRGAQPIGAGGWSERGAHAVPPFVVDPVCIARGGASRWLTFGGSTPRWNCRARA